ncbi:MAG: pitrilysin family protein [Pseudomonadota bacterium]
MRLLLTLCLVVPALTPMLALGQDTRISEVAREVVLGNGMRLVMVQRPGQPNIAAGWVARVGSANERPGITGISHLFEHMMFKGSDRIGTRDAALDFEIRNELDGLRMEMFALERAYRDQVRLGEGESITDPELVGSEMEVLKERFDEAIARQRENMIKDEFDKIYTDEGASGMNAFTNRDMTVYFIRVPRNKLELWFWMESERLAQPVFREFYSERDVVFEERRLRTDSTPTGAQDEVFESLLWRGHPYGWPVIGWPSDIAAITREQAEAFYDLYYAPANITLAIVGDFDEEQAVAWAESYFGRIPAGLDQAPDVITLAMPQLGELTYRAEVDAPPSATVAWRTVAYTGEGDAALQVLSSVLSGKTGRLYKRLVLQDQIATGAGARADSGKYDGTFEAFAQGKQGVSPDQLREVLLEEIALVVSDGITDYELEKVKNQLAADKYRRLEDPFFLLIQLLYYDGLREWRTMDTSYEDVEAVTAADVQAAAERYLVADRVASKLYQRKAGAEPEDPELAALDPAAQSQVKQMLGQLEGRSPDELRQALTRLEQMQAQVPEEAKAAMEYMIKKVNAMLEATP